MADRKGEGGRITEALSEQVRLLLIDRGLSVRQAADALEDEVSRQLVWRVAKALPMRSYVRPRGRDMQPSHFKLRLDFAKAMQSQLKSKLIDLDDILFTDESMIGCGEGMNRQNDRVWRMNGEFDDARLLLTKEKFRIKRLHMWVGISVKLGVVGPYFIDEEPHKDNKKAPHILTADRYQDMLENTIIPELKKRAGAEFSKIIFQQDGSSAHTAGSTISFLRKHFGNRIISLKTENVWPPHSPDSTPLDYWFWTRLKSLIAKHRPKTLVELKTLARLYSNKLSTNEIRRGVHNFNARIAALEENNDEHFEQWLKAFKRKERAGKICTMCDKIHSCSSEGCVYECLIRYIDEHPEATEPIDLTCYVAQCEAVTSSISTMLMRLVTMRNSK